MRLQRPFDRMTDRGVVDDDQVLFTTESAETG
jgi:hypothetical protein